ncbi:MAG: hypothetical protein Q4G68_08410 [Planctomycetia bacterium]|nr:hypothetical protein [Planctomycetia bacterium]
MTHLACSARRWRIFAAILLLIVCAWSSFAGAQEDNGLLKKSGTLQEPELMLKTWLLGEMDKAGALRAEKYEAVETLDDVAQWQQERKDFFWKQLGKLWDKTPLNAKITGTLDKEVYRIEKIVFESLPGFYVTATAFIPNAEKYPAPWPGVLEVCGHSDKGKAYEPYQKGAALCASNGLFVLIMDPIDQGERIQFCDENGKSDSVGVPAHNLIGSSCIPLGRNTATYEVWDMTRALDYLDSREDVISGNYGVFGCSGGGTQTSYIMALDDRVAVASPSCYICGIYNNLTHVLGPQDAEQCLFGQAAFGMDHADYIIMRAPKPTLLCTVTEDFFNIEDAWESMRQATRIYTRFHLSEKVAINEVDATHSIPAAAREAIVRWMLRFLAGRDEMTVEPDDLPILTEDEIRSLPLPGIAGQENFRTTFDINRDLAKEYKPLRDEAWKAMPPEQAAELVRRTAGIRPLAEVPDVVASKVDESDVEQILACEPGIFLPLEMNRPLVAGETVTLYIDDQGHRGEAAQAVLADATRAACAVDLRGWGETQGTGSNYYMHNFFGKEGTEFYLAYLLGKTYVGMRTEDLLATARYLKNAYQVKIRLEADGYARTVALHAAVVEPDLFDEILLRNEDTITTWTAFVEKAPTFIPLTDLVHGALKFYDLDNLLASVKESK